MHARLPVQAPRAKGSAIDWGGLFPNYLVPLDKMPVLPIVHDNHVGGKNKSLPPIVGGDDDGDSEGDIGADELDSEDDEDAEGTAQPRTGAGMRDLPDWSEYVKEAEAIKAGCDWTQVSHDYVDPDFVQEPYTGKEAGLAPGWYKDGKLVITEKEVMDPMFHHLRFMPPHYYKTVGRWTDRKHTIKANEFDAEEAAKADADPAYNTRTQRRYKNIGKDWYKLVRWHGIIQHRGVHKPGCTDHPKAFSKTGHRNNAGSYDQDVAAAMTLMDFQQYKRYYATYNPDDKQYISTVLNPNHDDYDPCGKVRFVTDTYRCSCYNNLHPSKKGSYDEVTCPCCAYGPGGFFRVIKGKAVATEGFQAWVWAFALNCHIHPPAIDDALSQADLVQVTSPMTLTWRKTPHPRTGKGGPEVVYKGGGLIVNQMIRNFMDLPADFHGATTYMDNLFHNFVGLNAVRLAMKMQFVLTLPAKYAKAGNSSKLLSLPPISAVRPREYLRSLPPRVSKCTHKGCTCGNWLMLACWDTGELRMMCNDRSTVYEYVERSSQRRRFKGKVKWKKIALANDYSSEMNVCDVCDFCVFLRKCMIQSTNWTLYPTECIMDYVGVSAYAAHVMAVAAWQREHKSSRLQPWSRPEFFARLAFKMLTFTSADQQSYAGAAIMPIATPTTEAAAAVSPAASSGQGQQVLPKKASRRTDASAPAELSSKAEATRLARDKLTFTGGIKDRYVAGLPHKSMPLPAAMKHGKSASARGKVCQFCGAQSARHFCGTCGVALHGNSQTSARSNTAGQDWPCHDLWHDVSRKACGHGKGMAFSDWKSTPIKDRPAFVVPAELAPIKNATKARDPTKKRRSDRSDRHHFS